MTEANSTPAVESAKLRSRQLEEPRLRPGVRVRYNWGKWDCCSNEVRHNPDWASQPWAGTQIGTTVDDSEFPGHIYPESHPWGIPSFASVVRFDGEGDRVTWVRTSCLDVFGDAMVERNGQQELLFETAVEGQP